MATQYHECKPILLELTLAKHLFREDICTYIHNNNNGDAISLAQFLKDEVDFIASHTGIEEDYRSVWSSRFMKACKTLNVAPVSKLFMLDLQIHVISNKRVGNRNEANLSGAILQWRSLTRLRMELAVVLGYQQPTSPYLPVVTLKRIQRYQNQHQHQRQRQPPRRRHQVMGASSASSTGKGSHRCMTHWTKKRCGHSAQALRLRARCDN